LRNSNPLKFIKQYRDQGIALPLLGGSTVADDSIMRNFGEAIDLINSIPYTRTPPAASPRVFTVISPILTGFCCATAGLATFAIAAVAPLAARNLRRLIFVAKSSSFVGVRSRSSGSPPFIFRIRQRACWAPARVHHQAALSDRTAVLDFAQ
jgi:hypothetical protein